MRVDVHDLWPLRSCLCSQCGSPASVKNVGVTSVINPRGYFRNCFAWDQALGHSLASRRCLVWWNLYLNTCSHCYTFSLSVSHRGITGLLGSNASSFASLACKHLVLYLLVLTWTPVSWRIQVQQQNNPKTRFEGVVCRQCRVVSFVWRPESWLHGFTSLLNSRWSPSFSVWPADVTVHSCRPLGNGLAWRIDVGARCLRFVRGGQKKPLIFNYINRLW